VLAKDESIWRLGSALFVTDNSGTVSDEQQPSQSDELWMEEALRAAHRALEAGEVPVGAVVVCEGKVVSTGWNRNLTDHDPIAHAEAVALRAAGVALVTIVWAAVSCLLQLNLVRCVLERLSTRASSGDLWSGRPQSRGRAIGHAGLEPP